MVHSTGNKIVAGTYHIIYMNKFRNIYDSKFIKILINK